MEITVLVDNNSLNDQYYFAEPAVSYYIVDGKNKLLFDTGYSDAFIKNASLMNININNIDSIIISHGHEDHSNGLKYYLDSLRNKKIKLYAHPKTFNKKKLDGEMICSPYSLKLLSEYFTIKTSKKPVFITDNLVFLGEIPEKFDFEKREPMGTIKIDDKYYPDYLYDDTALVYKGWKGLFIITGCSHSGICSIVEYAKKICKDDRIVGILGGLHLNDDKNRLNETIKYFKENDIKSIYPCHCTSLYAKAKMINELDNVKEVGVGLKINIK